jgi:hypothetical protein
MRSRLAWMASFLFSDEETSKNAPRGVRVQGKIYLGVVEESVRKHQSTL